MKSIVDWKNKMFENKKGEKTIAELASIYGVVCRQLK